MKHLSNFTILLLGCYISLVISNEEGLRLDENSKKCSTGESGCSSKDQAKKNGQLRLALPMIDGVKVGHEQEVELIKGRTHKMKTLSLNPPVFEIPDLFSADECDLVVDLATNKGMKASPVIRDPREISNDTTQETFDKWDTNNDSFVDPEEILYLPGKSDLYFTEDDVQKMFKDLDIDQDGNGKMSLEEFAFVKVDTIKQYFDKLRESMLRMRSRNNKQTWLWHDEDELLQYEDLLDEYHDRFARLTKLPRKIIENSEPLQVVQYEEHGHSHCHHDSGIVNKKRPCCTYGAKDCRLCRYMTVQVFLNDVEEGGELAFPLADNETFTWESWTKQSITKCNMVKHCSESNLIVNPEKGKAVLYYNHLIDRKSQWLSALNLRSSHGVCDVTKGQTWVANMWINVIGDGVTELRSWKMNSNWLSENNVNDEIVTALKRADNEESEVIEEEEKLENRYTEDKNINTAEAIGEDQTLEHPPQREGEELLVEVVDESTPPPRAASPPPPRAPPVKLKVTPAPLPLPKEDVMPKGPEVPVPPLPKEEVGHRVLRSVMLLIDELDHVELEIVARNLHTRLKLVCVPLMINPMSPLR